MSFPFNVYALALVGALVTSCASLPLWRAWCRRVGHVDDPGHRKIHSEPVPLAGGLAVMTGFFVPILVGALALLVLGDSHGGAKDQMQLLHHGLDRRVLQLAAILAGALGMVVLGWIDDKHELRPAVKFAGQFLIAGLVAASGIRITLFVHSVVFSYAITILWVLTLINALNFMDNMNGLCTGLGAIAAWFFALSSGIQGQYLVTLLALLTCGALLGFLPYNFPKASAFLGDAGSHLVGYMLAVLAILPHFYSRENPNSLAVLSPLLILAVPLVDLVWVVLLRTKMGKPFWIGDTNHLSHRLVRRGLSKADAVLFIWFLAAAGGGLALLL
ncbi:MAG: undecaprenyl/decaprenyl-phosphate alpha-N-acetylglucosaminyl 1-phosphate transferase [Pedosphaera parvula]|nr:undecaprenyl/decaprenyl-phosphate alpha-N-acetylglucosaminyl 1-phosphate transferase [Pedosphaera parvula]